MSSKLTAGQAQHLETKLRRRARAVEEAIDRLEELGPAIWKGTTSAHVERLAADVELSRARARIASYTKLGEARIADRTRGAP